jgi:hypothetical protein
LGTQDTGQINVRENRREIRNGQSRDTGNIGHTRYRTKTNKTKQKQYSKVDEKHGPHQKQGWAQVLAKDNHLFQRYNYFDKEP